MQRRAGRAQLELPPGAAWEPLGGSNEVIDVLPDDTSNDIPLSMVALGLRGPAKELLAVMLVQTNSSNYLRDTTFWTAPCPRQEGVEVQDAAQGSPVRIDCLRYKRRADTANYLGENRPGVAAWMARHKIELPKPYSHTLFRYAGTGGAYIAVDVVADQRLLRPDTRTNEEFLHAGRPALAWSERLAEAARLSTGMMDGRFVVPPFPYTVPR
ncbi:MAG: hypothetical protein EOO29_42010 [Comamonadaceae bacterium]|nr:MAG: hypothetical protein EOO29_42010 [Comamonadaceae bacterium]